MSSLRLSQRQSRTLCFLFAATLLALSFAPEARAAEAQWSFSPTSWNFGEVIPGTGPTPPKAFVLTNTGEVNLQPAPFGISIESEADSGFEFGSGNTCGGKLAPGDKCEIKVIFNPPTFGPKEGKLEVQSQGSLAAPAVAELSGWGAGPLVSITPEEFDFGEVESGGASPPKAFTVRNDGVVELTISSLTVGPPEGFQISGGTCKAGVKVLPGASCTVDVILAPTIGDAGFGGLLGVVDNAFDSPQYATLRGTSLVQAPWSYVAPYGHNVRARVFIRNHPQHRTTARNAVFKLRGSSNASRFVCRLDHGPLKACGHSISYQGLSMGPHRFEVRAFNTTGDRHPGPPSVYHWYVRQHWY